MTWLLEWANALSLKLGVLVEYESHFHPLWISTFAIAAAVIYLNEKQGGVGKSYEGLIEYCFPKSYYWSKSTAVDVFLVVLNLALLSLFFWLGYDLFLQGHLRRFAFAVGGFLRENFGYSRPLKLSGPMADLAIAFAVFAAKDLGWFLSHYLFHKVPALWQFHKVHHSATTMTPITALRFHILEMVSFHFLQGLFAGLVVAAGIYFFGLFPGPFTVLSIPLFALLSRTFGLFRHSHIWISYGPVSYFLISPAMHQLHHSAESRHLDKNFGHYLSLWDWLAGTLYVPKEREAFRIGLAEGGEAEWNSWHRVLWLPFRNLLKRK